MFYTSLPARPTGHERRENRLKPANGLCDDRDGGRVVEPLPRAVTVQAGVETSRADQIISTDYHHLGDFD